MDSITHGARRLAGVARSGLLSCLVVALVLGFLYFLLPTPSAAEESSAKPLPQRAILYDEDPNDATGQQYPGLVAWRTVPAGGRTADVAVRADVEIPDRGLKATLVFKRNTDPALPASHTVEVTFIVPEDFSGGSVDNVPGLLTKFNEQARGAALRALAMKVADGVFLVALSNVEADRKRNIQLLTEHEWLDIPMIYGNERRAILAIEKGASGDQAFANALASWGQSVGSNPQPADRP